VSQREEREETFPRGSRSRSRSVRLGPGLRLRTPRRPALTREHPGPDIEAAVPSEACFASSASRSVTTTPAG